MTGWEIGLLGVALFVGSLVYSTFGFGMGLVAVPFMLLVDARLVPGSFLIASIAVTAPQLRGIRDDVDWRAIGSLTIGRIPGSVLAAVLLARASESLLAIGAALSILAAVGVSLAGYRLPRTRAAHIAAGMASGMSGTIAGVGGPPAVLALQHLPVERLRATMICMAATSFAISIPLVALAGKLGRWQLLAAAALGVPIFAGMIASRWIRPHIRHPDAGRWAVLTLSTFGSLGVLARELLL